MQDNVYETDGSNSVNISLDEFDDVYIYFAHPARNPDGIAVRTTTLGQHVMLDFDKDGRLVGIEVLCGSRAT